MTTVSSASLSAWGASLREGDPGERIERWVVALEQRDQPIGALLPEAGRGARLRRHASTSSGRSNQVRASNASEGRNPRPFRAYSIQAPKPAPSSASGSGSQPS